MKKYPIQILIFSVIGALVVLVLLILHLFNILILVEDYIYLIIAYGIFQVIALICLGLLGFGIWRKNRKDEKEQHYQKNIHN